MASNARAYRRLHRGDSGLIAKEHVAGSSNRSIGRRLRVNESSVRRNRAALIPVSPARMPLKRRFSHWESETVWFMTPSGVPERACMPTKSAASQP